MPSLFARTLVGVTLAVSPELAVASDAASGFDVVSHIFDASDTDHSGALSRAEYTNAGLERYGVSFEEYDTNADGEASREEYHDVYQRYHPAEGSVES